MVFDMVINELSPGVIGLSFAGRLVLGNRLSDVEHAIVRALQTADDGLGWVHSLRQRFLAEPAYSRSS